MPHEKTAPGIRDLVLGVLIILLGGIVMKYADLPTTVAVQENRITTIEQNFSKLDSKMDSRFDEVLKRLPRR